MLRQMGEGEKPKKKVEIAAERRLEPDLHREDTVDEIDPADFFDPEEFGYRRRGAHDRA